MLLMSVETFRSYLLSIQTVIAVINIRYQFFCQCNRCCFSAGASPKKCERCVYVIYNYFNVSLYILTLYYIIIRQERAKPTVTIEFYFRSMINNILSPRLIRPVSHLSYTENTYSKNQLFVSPDRIQYFCIETSTYILMKKNCFVNYHELKK